MIALAPARAASAQATSRVPVTLALQYAVDPDGLPVRSTLRRWVRAAVERPVVVTLRFVAGREGRQLNARFRGKRYATNVLTFVYDDLPPLRGDVVLCVPVIRREAKAQRKRFIAHCAHLVVHGMLHLQGYDHLRRREATLMEAREAKILARLGYPDPYAP